MSEGLAVYPPKINAQSQLSMVVSFTIAALLSFISHLGAFILVTMPCIKFILVILTQKLLYENNSLTVIQKMTLHKNTQLQFRIHCTTLLGLQQFLVQQFLDNFNYTPVIMAIV